MEEKTLSYNDDKVMNKLKRRGKKAEYHNSKINRKEREMKREGREIERRKERWEERKKYKTVVFQSKGRT